MIVVPSEVVYRPNSPTSGRWRSAGSPTRCAAASAGAIAAPRNRPLLSRRRRHDRSGRARARDRPVAAGGRPRQSRAGRGRLRDDARARRLSAASRYTSAMIDIDTDEFSFPLLDLESPPATSAHVRIDVAALSDKGRVRERERGPLFRRPRRAPRHDPADQCSAGRHPVTVRRDLLRDDRGRRDGRPCGRRGGEPDGDRHAHEHHSSRSRLDPEARR